MEWTSTNQRLLCVSKSKISLNGGAGSESDASRMDWASGQNQPEPNSGHGKRPKSKPEQSIEY